MLLCYCLFLTCVQIYDLINLCFYFYILLTKKYLKNKNHEVWFVYIIFLKMLKKNNLCKKTKHGISVQHWIDHRLIKLIYRLFFMLFGIVFSRMTYNQTKPNCRTNEQKI